MIGTPPVWRHRLRAAAAAVRPRHRVAARLPTIQVERGYAPPLHPVLRGGGGSRRRPSASRHPGVGTCPRAILGWSLYPQGAPPPVPGWGCMYSTEGEQPPERRTRARLTSHARPQSSPFTLTAPADTPPHSASCLCHPPTVSRLRALAPNPCPASCPQSVPCLYVRHPHHRGQPHMEVTVLAVERGSYE